MAASAPSSYLIGHITKHTAKGGILIETSINGETKSDWFGEKIVKTAEDGMKFIPEGAVAKKEGIGIKARVKLPNYAEEMAGNAKSDGGPSHEPPKKASKSELMRKCLRAAKKVVNEELSEELPLNSPGLNDLRVDAILRIANSFYIDETKNARMDRIR
jgi:hypothetical protein